MNLKLASTSALLLGVLTGCPAASTPPATPAAPAATTTPSAQVAQSATPVAQADSEFLIVPDVQVGPITKDSTEASIRKAFGDAQVKPEKLYVGDGQELPGLAIYPDDPEKRVEVIWQEENPSKIAFVQIQGERSKWKTKEGVTLGTSLAELEKLNGRAFDLFGLGWDFGGTVVDWKGGNLDALQVRVADPADTQLSQEETSTISGDQTISSDTPALKKVNPTVFKIVVPLEFREPTPTSSPASTPTP